MLRCLPIIEIKLELKDIGTVQTKAMAVDKSIEMTHYLLEKSIQKLIDKAKLKPKIIGVVVKRQQTRREATLLPP